MTNRPKTKNPNTATLKGTDAKLAEMLPTNATSNSTSVAAELVR